MMSPYSPKQTLSYFSTSVMQQQMIQCEAVLFYDTLSHHSSLFLPFLPCVNFKCFCLCATGSKLDSAMGFLGLAPKPEPTMMEELSAATTLSYKNVF